MNHKQKAMNQEFIEIRGARENNGQAGVGVSAQGEAIRFRAGVELTIPDYKNGAVDWCLDD